MNKVYLDTNAFIDILTLRNRRGSEYIKMLREVDFKDIYISVLSIHIAYYVLKIKPNSQESKSIKEIFDAVNVLSLSEEIVKRAMEVPYKDFEDCLQYLTALEEGCDTFLTGDQKDFDKIQELIPSKMEVVVK